MTEATKTKREWCLWFLHDWAMWKDHSTYEKSFWKNDEPYEIGVVQERRCKRCNSLQRREVAS